MNEDNYLPHDGTTPERPELVKGFWYKTLGEIVQFIGTVGENATINTVGGNTMFCNPHGLIPATLDDLAVDMGGVNVWMAEESNGEVAMYSDDGHEPQLTADYVLRISHDERPIARHIAAQCDVPIIPEAQWTLLTNFTHD